MGARGEEGRCLCARRQRNVAEALEKSIKLDATLDAEQRKAAEHILNSRDRVILLSGAAGAGKTYTMQAVRQVIEKSGKKLGAFAQSTQASRKNLQEAGFENAETIAKLRTDEKASTKLGRASSIH